MNIFFICLNLGRFSINIGLNPQVATNILANLEVFELVIPRCNPDQGRRLAFIMNQGDIIQGVVLIHKLHGGFTDNIALKPSFIFLTHGFAV